MTRPGTGAPRYFTVGETIHLHSRVSQPGTRTPTDPAAVSLVSMVRDGVEVLDAAVPFLREREGEYALVLSTDTLEPGSYRLVVRHEDGPERVALAVDGFVLQSPDLP